MSNQGGPKDVISSYTGGGDFSADPDGTFEAQGALRVMQRAVVVESLDNLSVRDRSQLDILEANVTAGASMERLKDAPRNSILARLCSNGKGRAVPALSLIHI